MLLPFLTGLFEELVVGRHHGAQAVQNQRSQLQGVALRALVVVQGVVCEQEPALLQLQRRSAAVPHLFVQPACRESRSQVFGLKLIYSCTLSLYAY